VTKVMNNLVVEKRTHGLDKGTKQMDLVREKRGFRSKFSFRPDYMGSL
jgi:hypothetical protein